MADRLTSMARTSRREVRERQLIRHFDELNRPEWAGDLLTDLVTNALTVPRTGGGVE